MSDSRRPSTERVELAPGVPVQVEDASDNHWVGTCGNVLVVVLRAGSHSDPTHIHAVGRALTRAQRSRTKVRVLVIWPPANGRPPSSEVRDAIAASAALTKNIERAAGVVLGTGFAPAVHRSAATGFLALFGTPFERRIVSSIDEGVRFLVEDATVAQLLAHFCAGLVG